MIASAAILVLQVVEVVVALLVQEAVEMAVLAIVVVNVMEHVADLVVLDVLEVVLVGQRSQYIDEGERSAMEGWGGEEYNIHRHERLSIGL